MCCQGVFISRQFVCRPAGIAVLIVASFFPPVYYGFMCHIPTQIFYLTTTTALGKYSCGLLCHSLHCARGGMLLMLALVHHVLDLKCRILPCRFGLHGGVPAGSVSGL